MAKQSLTAGRCGAGPGGRAWRACRAAALLACLLPPGGALAETFELGGMYTFHYRDGRYADWGDYALHGARIAIDDVNNGGMLGRDRISLALLEREGVTQYRYLVTSGAYSVGNVRDGAQIWEMSAWPKR